MGVDIDAFIAAVWAHEGFGSMGNNGHEAQGVASAGKLEHDPRAGVEDLWSNNSSGDLHKRANFEVWDRGKRISNEAASHDFAGTNWSGTIWIWNTLADRYEQVHQAI